MPFGEPARFGSVLVTLYPPGPDTVLWESRVSQVYAQDADAPDIGGFFLCIDATPSQQFIDNVAAGRVPAPRLLGMSNNAQVTPRGVFGSLDCYNGSGQETSRHRSA